MVEQKNGKTIPAAESKARDQVSRQFSIQDFPQLLPLNQLQELFPEEHFRHLIEEDQTAIKYEIQDDTGKRWITFKLRDRRFDATNWFPTALTHKWGYSSQADAIDGPAVETSKYWGDPRYPLAGYFSPEVSQFIENPFEALPYDNASTESLLVWLRRWNEVVCHPQLPYPGQFSLYTVKGLNRSVFERGKAFCKDREYSYLSAMPTWYHVAKINEHFGFTYHDPNDAETMQKLDDRLLENNTNASWIVMLQFWAELAEQSGVQPERYVDPHFILRDDSGKILTYPMRPDHNLWQVYKL